MVISKIKKFIHRINTILSIGQNFYQGELYEYFDKLFIQLEKKEISAEDAKIKVNKLFTRNKELNFHFSKWIQNNKSNFSSIGQMIRPFKRIRFGVIFIKQDEYEPVHYHGGFSSFQIVLKGNCVLDEFDAVKVSKSTIKYRSYKRLNIKENDVMLNYTDHRDIHGFGAINGPVYILSVAKFYGFLGKFKLNFIKPEVNKRFYVDIKNQKTLEKGLFESPLIDKNEAYTKYINLELIK